MLVFKKCQYFVGKNGEILISRKKKNEYFFRCTLFSASIIIIISSPNYFFFLIQENKHNSYVTYVTKECNFLMYAVQKTGYKQNCVSIKVTIQNTHKQVIWIIL